MSQRAMGGWDSRVARCRFIQTRTVSVVWKLSTQVSDCNSSWPWTHPAFLPHCTGKSHSQRHLLWLGPRGMGQPSGARHRQGAGGQVSTVREVLFRNRTS
jgi:hypothetical protein